jgi:V/A-type H+/Na+-transporting ATPase subunit D
MSKTSPTRINLLNQKKDLKTAQKGYKLLKDKRDGLMKKFMEVIKQTKDQRRMVEKELSFVFHNYIRASSILDHRFIVTALAGTGAKIKLKADYHNLMSVPIPEINSSLEGNPLNYSYLETNGDLDTAINRLAEILPALMKLAEMETTIENLSLEIEKTRRRTSALEHKMIPTLEKNIRFISDRLEEQGRETIVRTMRIKAMVTANE